MISETLYHLSPEASSRMLLHNKWSGFEAPKRGLRDPWKHRPDGLLNVEEIMMKLGDTEIPASKSIYKECSDEELAAWKKERDEYMRQRDEWIALQMFQKYGYETFLEDCRMYNLPESFVRQVRPCDSTGDPQCSFDCPIYETCERR